ncbi:MAG: formate dehydrogenase family accessory protein FdhD [Firmicutes bacterium HGW-Firmicutes-11]|jgi:FdhD protein|nr:MAG: formate dehydrogenase family accessory protein FdhD [Firmicutes bacterium HGW-Firmicutes-11]
MDNRLTIVEASILRWKNGEAKFETDYLSVEEPLALEVNGKRVAVLMRLPGAEKELAVGFLISEGIIANFQDIMMLSHCGQFLPEEDNDDPLEPSRNIVKVTATALQGSEDAATLLIRSGCGRTRVDDITEQIPVVDGTVQLDARALTELSRTILSLQDVRKVAGGVHLAALFDANGSLIVSHEDVGRHNAADKVFGHALLHGIPLHDKILYNTGRASYELVTKGARLNVPILVSKSSPTSLAVEFAEASNITLCGFVQGNRANIYSGMERILL